MAPVVGVFLVWDAIAICLHVWHSQPRPHQRDQRAVMPLEEMLLFHRDPAVRTADPNAGHQQHGWLAGCGATVRRAANDRTRIHAARVVISRGGGLCAGIGGTTNWALPVSPPTGYRWVIVLGSVPVDGWLTKLSPIVIYDDKHTSGPDIPWDFLFGWALVTPCC